MNAGDLASIILTLLSSAVIIVGGIRWYIQAQIEPIKDDVKDIRAETKTNGGSSMRDEIKAIKKEQEEAREVRKQQAEKLDHMYEVLLDYISKNSK